MEPVDWIKAQHRDWEKRKAADRAAHIIIVTGGRNYQDRDRVFAALDKAHAKERISLLVHGGAPGADTLADEWAKNHGVERQVFEADWSLGPRAGPLRNQAMVDAGAAGVIAFPGNRGTEDCVARARAAVIPIWEPYRN